MRKLNRWTCLCRPSAGNDAANRAEGAGNFLPPRKVALAAAPRGQYEFRCRRTAGIRAEFRTEAPLMASLDHRPENPKMKKHLDRLQRLFPLTLGFVSLLLAVPLLLQDAWPRAFSARAHALLGALPLALIAVAYLIFQFRRRPGREELFKAVLLSIAFFFWAANQYWADSRFATLFNDIAIALFVLDVFFVLAGWPSTSPDESFAEAYVEPEDARAAEEPLEAPGR
jgi:hypothetical protein